MRWGVEDTRCEYWQGRGLWSLPLSFTLSTSFCLSSTLFYLHHSPNSPSFSLSASRRPSHPPSPSKSVYIPPVHTVYFEWPHCLVYSANQYYIKDKRTIKSKRRNDTMKSKETSESLWWDKNGKMEWREGTWNLQIKQLLRRFTKRVFNQCVEQWLISTLTLRFKCESFLLFQWTVVEIVWGWEPSKHKVLWEQGDRIWHLIASSNWAKAQHE